MTRGDTETETKKNTKKNSYLTETKTDRDRYELHFIN